MVLCNLISGVRLVDRINSNKVGISVDVGIPVIKDNIHSNEKG